MKIASLFLVLFLFLAACGDKEAAPQSVEPAQSPLTAPTLQALPVESVLLPGESYDGVIEAPGVPVRFSLNGETGNRLILQLARIEGSAVFTLEWFAPSGNSLFRGQNPAGSLILSDQILLTESGEYTLGVSGDQAGAEYRLIVIDARPAPTATITPTPTETPDSTETPTPTLTPAATETPSSTFTLAAPTAAPTLTPAPDGGRISVGQTHRGEIIEAGQIHRFTVAGIAGETLSIVVNPDPDLPGTFDPYLQIQGPDGQIAAENDNWREELKDAYLSFAFPTTGIYSLYISSADGYGVGGYLLSVSDGFTLRDVERGQALENVPNNARLETFGAREVWRVELSAGDAVRIAADALNPAAFNIMLELVSPEGESWFDDDSGEGTNALLDNIIVTESGLYRIHIAGRNNAFIGDYVLSWQQVEVEPTGIPTDPPTATVTTTPTITPTRTPPTPGSPSDSFTDTVAGGEVFTYFVSMDTGQSINIVVLGAEGFDPILRLYDPADKLIIEVDDVDGETDPRYRLTAEESGLYRLEILGYENTGGSFTLSYIIQ